MNLCRACDSFARALYVGERPYMNYKLHDQVSDLLSSAATCRLCQLIVSLPLCNFEDGRLNDRNLCLKILSVEDPTSEIYLEPITVCAAAVKDQSCFCSLTLSFPRSIGFARAAIWSEQGSLPVLAGHVCSTKPLSSDHSPESFELIRSWIDDYLLYHDACKTTVSGDVINENIMPRLPKRVLDIGDASYSPSVKLIETHGRSGRYVSLSHYWGSITKQPLKTTKDSIKDHLNGIAFKTLPKTFQDAVTVTHAIGIRYLWIDSLCTLQDDKKDWLQESAQMGSIYERAYLTIAASNAIDSTEGCFISRRPDLPTVEIPYYSDVEDAEGSIYISALPPHEPTPAWGPLRKRAWALQEWYLSRRMVHFTKGGLGWKCKEDQVDERQGEIDMEAYQEWDSVLERYSESLLTYETDRLIALQGIVNEMQKSRSDRYCLGIWTADLPGQLLWMCEASTPEMDTLHGIPSWTWASRGGSKVWIYLRLAKGRRREIKPDQFAIDELATLEVRGFIKRCSISENVIPARRFSHSDSDAFSYSPEMFMRECRSGPIHYILDYDKAVQGLGLAVLDVESCSYSDIYCLFLSSSARHRYDPLVCAYSELAGENSLLDSFVALDGGYGGPDEMINAEGFCNQEDLDGVEYNGKSEWVYWVLLLQAVPDVCNQFRRVGMGFVHSGEWAEESIHQLIYIL